MKEARKTEKDPTRLSYEGRFRAMLIPGACSWAKRGTERLRYLTETTRLFTALVRETHIGEDEFAALHHQRWEAVKIKMSKYPLKRP